MRDADHNKQVLKKSPPPDPKNMKALPAYPQEQLLTAVGGHLKEEVCLQFISRTEVSPYAASCYLSSRWHPDGKTHGGSDLQEFEAMISYFRQKFSRSYDDGFQVGFYTGVFPVLALSCVI